MEFAEMSYARHAGHFAADLIEDDRIAIAKTWFDETTADYWRHARTYECATCLASERNASWLTIGDGRFGLDSIRLRQKGFSNVLPTDISEHLLKVAKERGLIDAYAVENAERLSFQDRQFDYVFCKEALHHFPRPYLALYEMLRVARKAVFVIEPNDARIGQPTAVPLTKRLLQDLLHDVPMGLLARLRGKSALVRVHERSSTNQLAATAEWEDSGNYIYAFSRREAEKLALGLNLPQLAIKGLNDHYIEGCELEPADIARSAMFREMLSTIERLDQQCTAGLRDHMVLMVGIFVEPMTDTVRHELAGRDWSIIDLPRNPHVQGGKSSSK